MTQELNIGGRFFYRYFSYPYVPAVTLLAAKTYLIFKLQVNKKPSCFLENFHSNCGFWTGLGSRAPTAQKLQIQTCLDQSINFEHMDCHSMNKTSISLRLKSSQRAAVEP